MRSPDSPARPPSAAAAAELAYALYAYACLQSAFGPFHPEARTVSDRVTLPNPPPALSAADAAVVANVRRAVVFATATYGPAALALLSGSGADKVLEGMRVDTKAAVASRLGLDAEAIVLFEEHAALYRPSHMVALDRERRVVIVALRGTANILDSITNLTCSTVPMPSGGAAHEGMLAAARELAAGPVGAMVDRELQGNPGFGLWVVGHSLGAGVASLLVALWRDKYPFVQGYAFAPPGVLSLDQARALRDNLTAVVLGDDLICRLSLGSVEDLRNAIVAMCATPNCCERVRGPAAPV